MATNKNAQIRYQALDRCLSNWGKRFYIEDLGPVGNQVSKESNQVNGNLDTKLRLSDTNLDTNSDTFKADSDTKVRHSDNGLDSDSDTKRPKITNKRAKKYNKLM